MDRGVWQAIQAMGSQTIVTIVLTTEHYSYSAILAHTFYAGVIGVKMGNGYYTNDI